MIIGNLNIKPIAIYLPDDEIWMKEYLEAKEYFAQAGVEDIYWLPGCHAVKWGVAGRHIYLADNRPEEQFYIGDGKVGGFLTQYMQFVVMDALDYTHYMSLEGDCRFASDNWKELLAEELKNVPEDFDWLFVGSCCAEDKEGVHVAGNVYEYPYGGPERWNYYPQCSHCYIVAKKAIPHLIATNRDVASPSDVSVVKNSFPQMKVYAILPRLADQGKKTFLSL